MTVDTTNLSAPFNAAYDGRCALDTCEKHGRIEQGDVCQYILGELMHHACSRRVQRGQTAPLCKDCYCYHVGECA